MIDEQKVRTAVAEMTKNHDWYETLMNAPGAANLRIALAFYASKNLSTMTQQEKDEYLEFREQLERQLSAEELKYLAESFSRMGVDAARDHYNELFSKKTPEEQAEGERAYSELASKLKSANGGDSRDESQPDDKPQDGAGETPEEADGEGEGGEDER